MTTQLDNFTLAYIEAALWSTNDESDEAGGEPLDENYSLDDIHPDTLVKIKADCASFQIQCSHMFTISHYKGRQREASGTEHAGHDFWLTRNGHGAGFFDGDWTIAAEMLMDRVSEEFGPFDLYVGDDGMIHA